MPADYEKIREENIARYGWDTAVLDLLGQLYSERTHFIFELIQNAEDAEATELAFELFADRLELRHDGRPFTEADVRGVCGVGKSGKSGDLTAIGKFGIGFKSVYAYTRSPRISSGDEHFRIENYVRPFPAEPLARSGTLFVFPFDHDSLPAAVAAREIAAALTAIRPRILLFLRSIERLRVSLRVGAGVSGSVIERSVTTWPAAAGPGPRQVTLSSDGRPAEEWLIWQRQAVELAPPVEIAFRAIRAFRDEGDPGRPRLVPCDSSPLIVSFPTEKETFLGFLVQGPYRTTPARDNVPGHDPSNQLLVRETAALLCDVLRQLRDEGLLTVGVLTALPLDAGRFAADSMFRPLFDAVGEILLTEPLIPAAGGGYGVTVDLALGHPEVHELLTPGQLGALAGADWPIRFADESITEHLTPVLWRYLRDEIGIDEITPEAVVALVTGEFLEEQPDEWITRFYAFLFAHSALWREARAKPIIRLEDGSQVAPSDAEDRPAVYLPGPALLISGSSLPTVRRAIAGVAGRPAVPRGAGPHRTGPDRRGAPDHPAEVRRAGPRFPGGPGRPGPGPARRRRAVHRAGTGRRGGRAARGAARAGAACGLPDRGERRRRVLAVDAAAGSLPAEQGAGGLLRREPGHLVRGRPLRAVAGSAARDGRAAGGRGPRADPERARLRAGDARVRPERARS